jgi:histone H3/H4
MAKTGPEAKKAWKKGGGGFGPVSRPALPAGAGEPASEPARLTAKERAIQEIRRYQKDGGYLIPRTAFLRLTREIFNKVTRGTRVVRMEQSAIEALQMMVETHVALAFNSKLSFNFHIT